MSFSASRASLLSKCKYSFRADVRAQIDALPERPPSQEAQCGRTLHRAAEWRINLGHTDKLLKAAMQFGVVAEVPRLALQWVHMERWIRDMAMECSWEAEVKFALDIGRRVAHRLYALGERDYSEALPGEIPMTLDVLSSTTDHNDRPPRFYDWKTGRHGDGYSGQMGLNALAVADWLADTRPDYWQKWQRVEGGVLHVTPEGIDSSRVRVFDKFDLTAIATDLARDLEGIEESQPAPGDHCREMFCKAFSVCPATEASVNAVALLVPADSLVRRDGYTLSPTIRSADEAAWAQATLRTYDGFAEEVKEAIKLFVGEGEHPLTGGGVLKKTHKDMRRTSTADLIALARELGASDEQIANCTHVSRESAGIRVVGRTRKPEAA
jgi:hypothetical protein